MMSEPLPKTPPNITIQYSETSSKNHQFHGSAFKCSIVDVAVDDVLPPAKKAKEEDGDDTDERRSAIALEILWSRCTDDDEWWVGSTVDGLVLPLVLFIIETNWFSWCICHFKSWPIIYGLCINIFRAFAENEKREKRVLLLAFTTNVGEMEREKGIIYI